MYVQVISPYYINNFVEFLQKTNKFAKDKAYASSFCNVALLLSNTTLMRKVIDHGPSGSEIYKSIVLLTFISISIICQVTFVFMHVYIDKFLTKKIDEVEEEGENLIKKNGTLSDQKLEECGNITTKTERKMYENLENLNIQYSRLRFICIVLVFCVLLSNIFIAAFDNFTKTENTATAFENVNCTTLMYN